MTDADIIRECAGDPAAFERLFDRHHEVIRRYLVGRVGADDAEELAAEVFATAFARLHRYDLERENARPWLFGIASNLLRHHLRSAARSRVAYARSAGPSEERDWTEDTADRLDADLGAARAMDVIDDLDAADREVLLLFAYQGLHYSEVALVLGIPVGTVRSRLHRARQRVRDRLATDGPGLHAPA